MRAGGGLHVAHAYARGTIPVRGVVVARGRAERERGPAGGSCPEPAPPACRRVMLKVSGEALEGRSGELASPAEVPASPAARALPALLCCALLCCTDAGAGPGRLQRQLAAWSAVAAGGASVSPMGKGQGGKRGGAGAPTAGPPSAFWRARLQDLGLTRRCCRRLPTRWRQPRARGCRLLSW